jgi:hypothetical protein
VGNKKNKKKQAMDTSPKDGSQIDSDKVIAVTLEDLSEEGRQEIEQELEEERLASLQRKLAGFQKTRNGVVNKVAAPVSSAPPSTEISKLTSGEEIAHLIDALVASKFGTQMEHLTRTMNDSLFGKLMSSNYNLIKISQIVYLDKFIQ